jgi:hypothetical protein
MWHGVTIIDPKFPVRSGTNDMLPYLTGLAAGLGFDTIKLEFSVAYADKYPYTTWGTTATTLQ